MLKYIMLPTLILLVLSLIHMVIQPKPIYRIPIHLLNCPNVQIDYLEKRAGTWYVQWLGQGIEPCLQQSKAHIVCKKSRKVLCRLVDYHHLNLGAEPEEL